EDHDAEAGEGEEQLLDEVVRDHADPAVVLLLRLRMPEHLHFATPPSGPIGLTTPRDRTMTMCATTRNVTTIGKSITCRPYIWPKFRTLKKAPTPAPFMASLALTAMNSESKFSCETWPVNAVMMLVPKMKTPIIQVA